VRRDPAVDAVSSCHARVSRRREQVLGCIWDHPEGITIAEIAIYQAYSAAVVSSVEATLASWYGITLS
jgi:hypothetical protein